MKHLLVKRANQLGQQLITKKLTITLAESCTAGMAAHSLIKAIDCQQFFSRSYVTYTEQAKHEVLMVNKTTLEKYTAVSEQVVKEMAEGALAIANTHIAAAISGYAGPTGGMDGTPVGTVWFGWARMHSPVYAQKVQFTGDPDRIIEKAVLFLLERTLTLISDH